MTAQILRSSLRERKPNFTLFRWVLEPKQSTTLRVRFSSEKLAIIDQTLSFELLGTKKSYQIFCRGTCAFPTIDSNPKTLFPRVRRLPVKGDEIVAKQFIMPESVYTFGPLLCNKTREPKNRYVENMEKISFVNEGRDHHQALFYFFKMFFIKIWLSQMTFSTE